MGEDSAPIQMESAIYGGRDMIGIVLGALTLVAAQSPTLFGSLAGTWSCSTAGGSNVNATFTVAANGDVLEHQNWVNHGAGGTWDQTFSFDSQAGAWNVKNVGSNGWLFTGTTSGAVGNVAIVTGLQAEGTQTVPVRERFTFETPTAFQHTWEQQVSSGDWQPTSYAECKLAST
jgi:hypothetical protein